MQSSMVNRNLSTTASTQCFCPSTQKSLNNNIPILNISWHTYGFNFILSKVRKHEMVWTVGIWTRHFNTAITVMSTDKFPGRGEGTCIQMWEKLMLQNKWIGQRSNKIQKQ